MSAPFKRHSPPAQRQAGASGKLLALDCARNVYEAIDRRMPEAAALAAWLGQNAAAFGLPIRRFRTTSHSTVAAPRCFRAGLAQDRHGVAAAEATPVQARSIHPTDRWIGAIAETLALDPLEADILALALHYELDQRVERLFDAMSECRGGATSFHRGCGADRAAAAGFRRPMSMRG